MNFLKGYRKDFIVKEPKNFAHYLISFPLNFLWTISGISFAYLFFQGGQKYESPLLYILSSIPIILVIYNLLSEYYAYKLSLDKKEFLKECIKSHSGEYCESEWEVQCLKSRWARGKKLALITFYTISSIIALCIILTFVCK